MDMQSVMASTVHDVKNSLELINSQLDQIYHRLADSETETAVDVRRIQLECSRINNSMIHMLGLYKMESGLFRLSIEETYVPDIIEYVVSSYSALLSSMGIRLEVEFAQQDCLWFMDAYLVEGLLGNVVTNSIRYTRSRLTFEIKQIDDWLNIRVKDDGTGYPEEILSFVQQTALPTRQTSSTGLGLFFCRKIAEVHGNGSRQGYINLANDPDTGGAVFDLFLP